jgi:hypothetical protein
VSQENVETIRRMYERWLEGDEALFDVFVAVRNRQACPRYVPRNAPSQRIRSLLGDHERTCFAWNAGLFDNVPVCRANGREPD